MADSFTAKLGLKMPDVGDFYDVLKFNFNAQKIDDNLGVVICTSSTRPSAPWSGQQIYETDTRFSYVRSSGAWVQFFGYLTLAASAAARPSTGLYNGYAIWRTDKKWMEVYDGTAWRTDHYMVVGALADITNPITGQRAILTTDGFEYRWSGSAWLLMTGTTVSDTQATNGTTTSGAYTATLTGGTTCSVVFVATASGKVLIGSNVNIDTPGNLGLCSIEVRTGATPGSGTIVLAANNDDALLTSAQINISRTKALSGLTPGSSYNVRQLFAVTGGTGNFKSKHLWATT